MKKNNSPASKKNRQERKQEFDVNPNGAAIVKIHFDLF
jgi:hypothetical protein